MSEEPRSGRRIIWTATFSVLLLLPASAVYIFFVRTELGQHLDASSFAAVAWLRAPLGPWADRLRVVLIVASGILLFVLAVLALVRRRVRDVVVAAGIVLVTLLVSTALKDVILTRPQLGDFGYDYNTFPSDHEAITTAALIGSFLLLPERFRRPVVLFPLLVLGALSGLFQVVSFAHRASDVMAGALLAGAVAVWFPSRDGGIGAEARWVLWALVVLAALGGALCLASWQSAGYASAQQVVATCGILLCAAACVCASLAVGAEGRIGVGSPVSSAH